MAHQQHSGVHVACHALRRLPKNPLRVLSDLKERSRRKPLRRHHLLFAVTCSLSPALLQQLQHLLLHAVGLRQRADAGLAQHLFGSHSAGSLTIVGGHDRA